MSIPVENATPGNETVPPSLNGTPELATVQELTKILGTTMSRLRYVLFRHPDIQPVDRGGKKKSSRYDVAVIQDAFETWLAELAVEDSGVVPLNDEGVGVVEGVRCISPIMFLQRENTKYNQTIGVICSRIGRMLTPKAIGKTPTSKKYRIYAEEEILLWLSQNVKVIGSSDPNEEKDDEVRPTDAAAGSPEKIDELRRRYALGHDLHQDHDRRDYTGLTGAIRPRQD